MANEGRHPLMIASLIIPESPSLTLRVPLVVDKVIRALIMRVMAKQMYSLRDVPRYENIRAAAARYPELEPASGAAFVLLLRVASDMLAATDDYLAGFSLSQGRFVVMMLLPDRTTPAS